MKPKHAGAWQMLLWVGLVFLTPFAYLYGFCLFLTDLVKNTKARVSQWERRVEGRESQKGGER